MFSRIGGFLLRRATGRKTCNLALTRCHKLDKSAKEALAQINSREYSCRYETDEKRKVIKIGVNFDTKKRNIGEWILA